MKTVCLLRMIMPYYLATCRLSECNTLLKSLKSRRDALYMRLSEVLVAKV